MMLEAKDLMVGDWVRAIEINGKPTDQLMQIKVGGIIAIAHGLMKAEPIPLTEEILDMNGMYNDGKDNYHFRVRPAGTTRHDIVEKVLNCFGLCESLHEFQHLLKSMKIENPIKISSKICQK